LVHIKKKTTKKVFLGRKDREKIKKASAQRFILERGGGKNGIEEKGAITVPRWGGQWKKETLVQRPRKSYRPKKIRKEKGESRERNKRVTHPPGERDVDEKKNHIAKKKKKTLPEKGGTEGGGKEQSMPPGEKKRKPLWGRLKNVFQPN